ncbi:MAG TPA: CHAT domain-containing protein [Candidatus Angelobacter sp.]|nr:CHAT domain-containing protein [Candidatus Angelobacter sp.]
MNEKGHSGWPDEREIQKVAAGMAEPETAAKILQHAAECDHCGPLLNHYLEIFSEESSPEIETLIDQLPSSRPGWEQEKAREIVAGMRPSPETKPKWREIVLRWWHVMLRPRILATAGGLAALVIPMFIFGPGWYEAWQLNREQKLVAEAYAKKRLIPMRPVDAFYGREQESGGIMGSDDETANLRYPELNKAWSILTDKLNSGSTLGPKWYQMEGELLLLKNPAKYAQAAEKAFLKAKARGLDEPSLDIDLATSYFEQLSDNSKNLVDGTPIKDLLNRALQSSKATEDDKKAALFNLAILDEKFQQWNEAEDHWNQYLEIDPTGPWADEARTRLKEVERHLQRSKIKVYMDASFYLRHLSEPAVQDYTEEYLERATAWLLKALDQPGGPDAQALAALADELKTKHSDHLLHDLLITVRVSDKPALAALNAALQANRDDNVDEALVKARQADALFAQSQNIPGQIWARFAEVYAYQRAQSGTNCFEAASQLERTLQGMSYPWLQGQVALEKAMCGSFAPNFNDSEIEADIKRSQDFARHFPILSLRIAGSYPGLERQKSLECDKSWGLVVNGMKDYWNGTYPQERLYQFYAVLEQCAEQENYWYAARELLDSIIAMRRNMPNPDPNVLVALYVHQVSVLTALRDNAGARQAAEQAESTFRSESQSQFRAITRILLAECQLKQDKAEVALATMEPARQIIEQKTDNILVAINFRRVMGSIRLRLDQPADAEQEFRQGIEAGEGYLSALQNANQRIKWTLKTEPLYRGLTQTWLEQNRIVDAWKLWEWSKARSLHTESGNGMPTAWPDLQQAILSLPVPPDSGVRLVYAVFNDRLHVWMIKNGNVRSNWIPVTQKKLDGLVAGFVQNCADPFSPLAEVQEQGKALFDLLIAPFAGEFSSDQTVTFEADQQLWKLPISALITPDRKYVVEKYYIASSPGILVDASLGKTRVVQPQSKFLLVNAYPERTQELAEISPLFNHPVVLNRPTNKEEVLHAMARSEAVIYFGHTVRQGRAVALKLNDNVLLDAADFLGLKKSNLSLIVLAACSTGTGGRSGLLDNNALVRSFLVAGVPHVVASQWDVYNITTAQLMRDFFQNSLGERLPSRALGNAERKFLNSANQERDAGRDYRHPYYWAGFIAVGRVDSAESVPTKVALR